MIQQFLKWIRGEKPRVELRTLIWVDGRFHTYCGIRVTVSRTVIHHQHRYWFSSFDACHPQCCWRLVDVRDGRRTVFADRMAEKYANTLMFYFESEMDLRTIQNHQQQRLNPFVPSPSQAFVCSEAQP